VRVQRSNCLAAALRVWWRLGGRPVLVRGPSFAAPPWSLLPHLGIETRPGWVVHFAVTERSDFPLWFRGRLRRDWMGPPEPTPLLVLWPRAGNVLHDLTAPE
jgi:hypothetical protein